MFAAVTIRSYDLADSERFCGALAPQAGLRLRIDTPELAQFVGHSGPCSLVAGLPTEHLHMALPGDRDVPPAADAHGNRVELLARQAQR